MHYYLSIYNSLNYGKKTIINTYKIKVLGEISTCHNVLKKKTKELKNYIYIYHETMIKKIKIK